MQFCTPGLVALLLTVYLVAVQWSCSASLHFTIRRLFSMGRSTATRVPDHITGPICQAPMPSILHCLLSAVSSQCYKET